MHDAELTHLALGAMPLDDAVAYLSGIDADEAKEFIDGDPPYKFTSYVWGFIPQVKPIAEHIAISHVGSIAADTSLKGQRVNVSLNLINVARYPGSGRHNILFEFKAENQVAGAKEPLSFSARYTIASGGTASLINAPIFIGLTVGNNMMKLDCKTVNVENEDDRKFLNFLESDVIRDGLRLAATVQPAITPLSAMVTGITNSVLATRKNVVVQDFTIGLDFGGSPSGARLALGDYVAVQVSPAAQASWNWSDWVFKPATGQIVSASQPAMRIPFNYIVFGISRFVP